MRLWLIRHGETQANVDGLYSGHAPTPLTARGIEQAQNLHTLLHDVSFDLVLCSELERAQHTARLVLSDRQHPVHIIPELNEMFFGDWEMRHHRDLMLSPRKVKDFRHFRNVWNDLSQGLVNISTIRIF